MNDLILTVIGTGIGIVGLLYTILWNMRCSINEKLDGINGRLDKNDLEMKEIRTSLNRMEGAFYSKDCCVLKHETKSKQAD